MNDPDSPPPRRADVTKLLWEGYWRTRSATARKGLMAAYFPMLRKIACTVRYRLPECVEVEDLVSAGAFGLASAIEKFEPGRGFRFATYSPQRIRGAMLDWIREMDWVPRLSRSRGRKFGAAVARLQREMGRDPTDDEVAAQLDLSPARYQVLRRDAVAVGVTSLSRQCFETESGRGFREADNIPDRAAPAPADVVQRRALEGLLTQGFTRAERLIVLLYYFEGLTMREIGRTLGLSESRVSQMHAGLLPRIRARFDRDELEELLLAG